MTRANVLRGRGEAAVVSELRKGIEVDDGYTCSLATM